MVHNPTWQVHWCWQQGDNAWFCVICFQEDVQEDMLCASLLPTNTAATELLKSLIIYKENWVGHFMLVYAWMEYLPRLDSFLVSLPGSKRLILSGRLCAGSSIEKRWLAEKCHLSLTMFYRMWWKLLTTLKYMPLTHVCSHSCVRRWMQSLYMSSLIHR